MASSNPIQDVWEQLQRAYDNRNYEDISDMAFRLAWTVRPLCKCTDEIDCDACIADNNGTDNISLHKHQDEFLHFEDGSELNDVETEVMLDAVALGLKKPEQE